MLTTRSKASILICDSAPPTADDLKSRLEKLGYTVCGTTPSGREALILTKQSQPDLVFVDIALHGEMGGLETAEAIREKWGIPVVLLNVETGAEKLKRVKPTYHFGYLLSPFEDLDLRVSVEMALYVGKVDAGRKEAKKRLEHSELWLRYTFDSLDEAVFVVTTDRRLVSFNAAGERMFGYSKDEVAYLSTAVLHVDQQHYLEFGNKIKEPFTRGETANFEFFMKRKNGDIFPTEHSVSLIKNNSGESIGIVSVIRDITYRKQAEEALRESEERFREIIENTDAGYFFIDKDGIIQDVNTGYVTMYKYSAREEMIGMHFTSIQRECDINKANEFLSWIMQGKEEYLSGEFSRQCKDGSIGYHTYSAKPVIRSGEVVGIEGFIIDNTERKELERQRENLVADLQTALQEIKTLQGFIPICAHCKKIRDDKGYWQQIECYIAERTEAEFSHGICPDCVRDMYRKYKMK